ncbi:MAG: DUF2069 domain-containing protein [Burkholderiaceae bacterium]|nr:DUF2069 domain-containing protein [Burkholderiaceae bacterium]
MPSVPPSSLRRIVVACFVALIVLGIAWETWLAPLRPGAWLLSLKVVPLAFALPGIAAGRVRAYQWWSMLILGYLAEGLVRAASDAGLSARLAWAEIAIAAVAFTAIVLFVRRVRRDALQPG